MYDVDTNNKMWTIFVNISSYLTFGKRIVNNCSTKSHMIKIIKNKIKYIHMI